MASGDNVCIPHFEPGSRPSGKCTALVRGKRLVVPSADIPGKMVGTENMRIAEAGAAADNVVGVAVYEGANTEEIPLISGPGYIVPLVVGAAITFGQSLKTDAQGRVIPQGGTGPIVAVALETNAVVDTDVACQLKF